MVVIKTWFLPGDKGIPWSGSIQQETDRVLASLSGLQRVRVWLKHRGQDKGLTLALEGQ